jgi:hypothetical protein
MNTLQELIEVSKGVISPQKLVELLSNMPKGDAQLEGLKLASDYKVLETDTMSFEDNTTSTMETKVFAYGKRWHLKGDYLWKVVIDEEGRMRDVMAQAADAEEEGPDDNRDPLDYQYGE